MKLALGFFDGVHIGHQKIIEKAHRVITFDPHPNKDVQLLTTLAERRELVGNLDVLKFTKKIQTMYPQDFIEKIIVRRYHPETIVVGHDYAFGYKRTGDLRMLIELGKKFKFNVEIVPEVNLAGEAVRSSAIRHFLEHGEVERAAKYLSREYSLAGKIIHGHGRGRKMGFPTINIKPDHANKLVPGAGVYAGEVIVDNKLYPAAIFIGKRQTFNETKLVIEANLFNFIGNIYGKKAIFFFKKFIRPEQKFNSAEELAAQIKKDIKEIARQLKAEG